MYACHAVTENILKELNEIKDIHCQKGYLLRPGVSGNANNTN